MSSCVKCSAALKPSALFCTKCGQKVLAKETSQSAASLDSSKGDVGLSPRREDGPDCVKCANKLKLGAKFCVKCGTPVAGAASPMPARNKEASTTPLPSVKSSVDAAPKSSVEATPKNLKSPTPVRREDPVPQKQSPPPVRKAEDSAKQSPMPGRRAEDAVKSPPPKKLEDAKTPSMGGVCHACSNPLKPNALFCTKCGAKCADKPAPAKSAEKDVKVPAKLDAGGSSNALPKAAPKPAQSDPPVPPLAMKQTPKQEAPQEAPKHAQAQNPESPRRRAPSITPSLATSGGQGSEQQQLSMSNRSSMLLRSPRGGADGVPTIKTPLVQDGEIVEERRARKGSFRESVVLSLSSAGSRIGGARESMMISPEDRDAALAKINALMGTDAPTIVKIDCVLDGRVKKTLEVEAIDGIINGRSIQIAWNLSPEQELHVTFVGLRAPNGEEIPFETSDEVPWPHIPFWEEVIFPDEVYEILYEDDRDVDVDKLTDAEVAALEKEFDAMDTLKQGYLSRDGLVAYFSALAAPVEVSKVLGGREKRQDRTAKKIDPAMLALVNEQVDSIMAMDVSGGGSRVELHEYARSQASTIVLSRASARKSTRGKRLSVRISGAGK